MTAAPNAGRAGYPAAPPRTAKPASGPRPPGTSMPIFGKYAMLMARDGSGRGFALSAVPEPKRHKNPMHVGLSIDAVPAVTR